jgi:small-conductance mechanosensitive channel
MKMLELEILDNSLLQWSIAAGIAILVAVALGFISRFARVRVSAWAARSPGRLDDIAAAMLQATGTWFILLVAVLAAAQTLTLDTRVAALLSSAFAIALILQAGFWLNAGIGAWLSDYLARRRTVDATGATTAAILGFIARLALWALVVLMLLDNFGVDVTALVAGLGIGGVAVALAAQNILGDIFASLAIALDKPVVIGDFVVLDDFMGTVERVGLKTTHLRSLSGELIVLPNNDLLSSRIRNYQRMTERRVVLQFGVTYETSSERLKLVAPMVRGLLEAQPLARFDRAHMSGFGDFSINFEVVYFIKDPDYNKFMDVQQAINLSLLDAMREADIEFAYPTTRQIRISQSAEAE